MKFTSANTTDYRNTLILAIKLFMEENNLTEVSLADTVFNTKADWKSLIIKDGELLVLHQPSQFIDHEWTHDFEFVTLYDIINLQTIVTDKIYSLFSF